MKTLCFATENLNVLMNELFATTCEVVFCEEKLAEVIRFEEGREVALEDSFEFMEERFNVKIDSFDVLDLGDLGMGFAFYLQ